MMDDECVDENGAMVWSGLLALVLLGSCANMPHKVAHQESIQPAQIQQISNLIMIIR